MSSPFQTCWDGVDRAEVQRQALIGGSSSLDTQDIYGFLAKVDDNGDGQLFFRTVKRDWLMPFSLQLGEMLYQLPSSLDQIRCQWVQNDGVFIRTIG
jgi:hypothetical protein